MPHAATSRAPAGKWITAGTVILGSFVSVMDISIVNVALPQMLGTFGVSLDAITWVAVAYSISEIILVTMSAWFSRLLGRKRFYIFPFVVFTVASVLCGLARSLEMMILARVLQGMGGGGLIPVAQAVMLETFPEEERGMAMAVYMMGVVVAPTVGPVLGGWLTDTYGWPWIFYINLPTGVFGIFLASVVLSDPPHLPRGLTRIDVVGIVLLATGLTALQIFLEQGERENWFESSFIIVTALAAAVALTSLVVWELWVEEPVVNLRVLRNVPFMAGTGLGFVFGITLFGSIFILPLFLQQLQGYEVFDSGLIQMPRMLVMLVFAPIAGRLYNLIDSRLLLGGSVLLMMIGYFDMAHFNLHVGAMQMLPSLLITGGDRSFKAIFRSLRLSTPETPLGHADVVRRRPLLARAALGHALISAEGLCGRLYARLYHGSGLQGLTSGAGTGRRSLGAIVAGQYVYRSPAPATPGWLSSLSWDLIVMIPVTNDPLGIQVGNFGLGVAQ